MEKETEEIKNRCRRCNRVLGNEIAEYGWRCAEILGVSQALNDSGDKTFNDFMIGFSGATNLFGKIKLANKNVNAGKFYESYIKLLLSLKTENKYQQNLARKDLLSSLYGGLQNPSLNATDKSSLMKLLANSNVYDYSGGMYGKGEDSPMSKSKSLSSVKHPHTEVPGCNADHTYIKIEDEYHDVGYTGKSMKSALEFYDMHGDGSKDIPLDMGIWTYFEDYMFPATTVGGSKYAPHSLSLSNELQQVIAKMASAVGVDYYLVLATIAHESGSIERSNEDKPKAAAGYMQITPSTWSYYGKPSGQYYDENHTKAVRDIAKENGADLTDKYDGITNIAVGIAQYKKWSTYKSFGTDMSQVVNHYGEGSGVNYGIKSEYPYPIIADSTYEILYYRDVLANKAGMGTWYVGDLYDIDGKRLK